MNWSLHIADPVRLTLSKLGEHVAELPTEDGQYIDANLTPNTRHQYLLTLERADGTRSFRSATVVTLAAPPRVSRQMRTHDAGFQIPIVDDANPDYTEYQITLTDVFGQEWAVTNWSTDRCQTLDGLDYPGFGIRLVARNLDGVTTEPVHGFAEDFRGEGEPAESLPRATTRGYPSSDDPWTRARIRDLASIFGLTDGAVEWMSNDISFYWLRGQPERVNYYFGRVVVGHGFPGPLMRQVMRAFWEYWDGFPEPCDRMNVYTFRQDVARFVLEFRELDTAGGENRLEPWRPYYNLIVNTMAGTPLQGKDHWDVLERGEYGRFGWLWHQLQYLMPHFNPRHPELIPPHFRKYLQGFMREDGDRTWDEELEWYLALEDEDRRLWSPFSTHDMLHNSPLTSDFPFRTRIPEPQRTGLRNAHRLLLIDFINTMEDHVPWGWWEESTGFWTIYIESHLELVPTFRADLRTSPEVELSQPNLGAVLDTLELLYRYHCRLGELGCGYRYDPAERISEEQMRAIIMRAEPLSKLQREFLLEMIRLRR